VATASTRHCTTVFHKQFQDTGFWSKDEGMLLIVSADDEMLGHIEFFKTVNYLDEYELSYQVYAREHRGKGVATEAVDLLVRYLFETKRVNRIRLVIHPNNVASRRLAEKCGFRHEGTARGAWYHKGKHHDVEIYALLHDDVITG
jgi:RimJ/RimL family protein N-acetyltransferase